MAEYRMKRICKHAGQDRKCLLTDKNCIGYEICDNYKEKEIENEKEAT
jgi:hypothetical protein